MRGCCVQHVPLRLAQNRFCYLICFSLGQCSTSQHVLMALLKSHGPTLRSAHYYVRSAKCKDSNIGISNRNNTSIERQEGLTCEAKESPRILRHLETPRLQSWTQQKHKVHRPKNQVTQVRLSEATTIEVLGCVLPPRAPFHKALHC